MIRWPYALTVTVSPGSTTVVDAASSMIAGPAMTFFCSNLVRSIDRRFNGPGAFEDHHTGAAPSICRRSFVAGGDLAKLRFSEPPDRRYTQAHDVGGLFRRAVAIAQLVGLIEQPLDFGARGFIADAGRHSHRHRVFLTDIAHIGGALEDDPVRVGCPMLRAPPVLRLLVS